MATGNACADTLTIPYVFSPNTTIQSAQVNSNFSSTASIINGLINNANIKAAANINPSKLNLTTAYLNIASAADTLGFGVGQSGDTIARGGIYGDGSLQMGAGSSSATDIGLKRSAANTVQFYVPGGGTPKIDFNSATSAAAANALQPAAGGLGVVTVPTNGQIPIGDGTKYDAAVPTAGNGVDVTTGAGTLTLASNGDVQGLRISISSTLAIPADGTSVTVYTVPYTSKWVRLYNASNVWVVRDGSGLSFSVAATTNTNYDVYVYDNAGTATIGTVAWSNQSTPPTRGTQDGVPYTNNNVHDRWIGCIATNGTSGTTEDDAAGRLVWNYNNQVARTLYAQIPVSTWTYASATVRASDGNTTNGQGRVAVLIGLANEAIDATFVSVIASNATSTGSATGIGIDSTTAYYNSNFGVNTFNSTTSLQLPVVSRATAVLAAGIHYVQMLENIVTGTTGTYSGTGSSTIGQSWLQGVTWQ